MESTEENRNPRNPKPLLSHHSEKNNYSHSKDNNYSFRPRINPSAISPTLDASLRLYSNDPREKHESAALAHKLKKEEEEIAHPFHPQIISHSAKSKCIGLSNTIIQNKMFPIKESANSEQCSFRPKTAEKHRKSGILSRYLNLDPFHRLTSSDAGVFKMRERKSSNESMQLTAKLVLDDCRLKRTKHVSSKSDLCNSYDFYDRLVIYKRQKEDKRDKLQKDVDKELTYSPAINIKAEVSTVSQKERLSRFMHIATECTFHPKINPSKEIEHKSPVDMINTSLIKKENTIQKLKEKIEEENKKIYTFKPQITERGIKSKLDINDPEFLQKYSKCLEKKDTIRQYCQKEKELEELKECTHKPKINKCVVHNLPKAKSAMKKYSEIHSKKMH